MATRFRDTGVKVLAFATYGIDVVCPRCAGRAVVHSATQATAERRLTCPHCAHTATWTSGVLTCAGPVDPYFGRPLWLRADCRGHTLWAFNREHLDRLESFVAAGLRERGPRTCCCGQTMLTKLPLWMKAANNRRHVLTTIGRLKMEAERERPRQAGALTR